MKNLMIMIIMVAVSSLLGGCYEPGAGEAFEKMTTKERLFHCAMCSNVFVRKHDLEMHLKYTHASDKITHECSKCSRKFARLLSLKTHLME